MTQQVWNEKTKKINQAVLLYCVLVAINGIMTLYQIVQIFNDLSRANGLGDIFEAIFGAVGPEDIVITVLLFISFVWLINTIKDFGSVQEDLQTKLSMQKVGSALWLNFWASVVACIPLLGLAQLIAVIMEIVSYVQMNSAFKYMMYSPVFNAQARSGAGTLKSYSVWSIWGIVPFIGAFCGVIAWLQFIRGWLKIGKGAPVEVLPVQPVQSQANIAINNSETAVQEQTLLKPYVDKATAKTDEELKVILQHKDDYNQLLVKAAEQVLLERIAGIPIQSPIPDSNEQLVPDGNEQSISDDEKYKAYQPKNLSSSVIQTEKKQDMVIPAEESRSVSDTEPNPVQASPESQSKPESEVSLKSETSQKSHTTLIVSVTVAVVLLIGGICGYFFGYAPYAKDRDALRTYVVANNVFLRSSQMAGVEYNVLGKVPYGSELITYNKGKEWAEVKVNGQKGYVASPYLLTSDDFFLLNGVWGDTDSKECIESTKCRLAILDFYKSNHYPSGTSGWQVYTRIKEQKPNTVFYPRLYDKNSKFTDFVFMCKNNQDGRRVMVGYSFDDETEAPIFRFCIGVPETGYIQNMRRVGSEALVSMDDGASFKFVL